jgi:hypothetical protein
MQMLNYAQEVIFTAERGMFTEPPQLRGKVHYVGRAVRTFEYRLSDRARARSEIGIPLDATVALFAPGGWNESLAPVADLVLGAWRLVPSASKRLIWLAGDDYDHLRARLRDDADVIVLRQDWKIDRLMAASNVLLTKANRNSIYEAAALGLPSISISTLANWPDDVAVAHVASNSALVARSLTPQSLRDEIVKSIAATPAPATSVSGGVTGAAERLAARITAEFPGLDLEATETRLAV